MKEGINMETQYVLQPDGTYTVYSFGKRTGKWYISEESVDALTIPLGANIVDNPPDIDAAGTTVRKTSKTEPGGDSNEVFTDETFTAPAYEPPERGWGADPSKGYGLSLSQSGPGSEYFNFPEAGAPELKDETMLQGLIENYRATGSETDKETLKNVLGYINPYMDEGAIEGELANLPSMTATGTQRGDLYDTFEGTAKGLQESFLAGISGAYGQTGTGMGTAARTSRQLGTSAQRGYEDAYDLFGEGLEKSGTSNVASWLSGLGYEA